MEGAERCAMARKPINLFSPCNCFAMRRTSLIGIGKMHCDSALICENNGFSTTLFDMLNIKLHLTCLL